MFRYANNIKNDFKNINSFKKFNKHIVNSKTNPIKITQFVDWVNSVDDSIILDKKDIIEDWGYLENRILANIASSFWGKNYYYKIMLNQDKQFSSAIENIYLAKDLIK